MIGGLFMDVITLSKRQFEKLVPLDLAREIVNTEGELFDFYYKRELKIFKKLYCCNGAIFANKLYTLEMLNTYSDCFSDSFCIPEALVAISRKIMGFTLPFIDGINMASFLKDNSFSLNDHLFYLKRVGEILQEVKYIRMYTSLHDFYLNDLHEGNFLVDVHNKKLSVVDLDSVKIGNNLSFPSRYLTPSSLACCAPFKYSLVDDSYSSGFIKSDENSDLYCYNIMILNYFRGSNVNNMSLGEFYNFLNYLDMIGIRKELLDIFNKMLSNGDNENPYLVLDDVSYKQLYLARTKVLK